MARVDAPACDRDRTVVLPHAVRRIRERRIERFTSLGNDENIRREVRRLVADAVANRSVHDQPPRQFTRPGRRARPCRLGQRIVVAGDVAFVVDVGLAPAYHVITVFVRLRDERMHP